MDLKRAFEIIWRRRIAVGTMIAIGLAAGLLTHFTAKRQYEAKSTVLLVNTAVGRDPSIGNLDLPSLVFSDAVLTRFKQKLGTSEDLRKLSRDIDAQVDTANVVGGNLPNVMPIGFRAATPATAVRGANLLAGELRDFYRQISTSRYDELARYLSHEVDDQRARLDVIDKKLQTLMASDPAVAQSEAATAIGSQMLALDQQRGLVSANLDGHLAQAGISGQHIQEVAPIVKHELLQNDPGYQAAAAQLAKDQATETLQRAQFSDKYPGLPGLVDQVHREAAALEKREQEVTAGTPASSPTYATALATKEQVEALVAADHAQLTALDTQLQTAQQRLARIPDIGATVAALRRRRDAAESAYQILEQQRTLTLAQQAEAASLGSIVIIDRATIAQRVVGKASLLVPVAATLGFVVLGFALPFVLELTDTRLRNRETIERIYRRPVIFTAGAA